MEKLRLRADKPRRALPPTEAAESSALLPTGSRFRNVLKRAATVVVVSGIAVAGFSVFTASTTNSTGTAFADQGLAISSIPAVQAASASDVQPSVADQAAARSEQLATNGDAIADYQYDEAVAARSAALGGGAKKIDSEIDRLKNLAKFLWPTEGSVASPYGMRRHPILGYTRMHDGDDIGGKCGQPIWAAQSGTVVRAATGYNGGSGNNVWIDHGRIDGHDVQTGYLHMENYSVSVGDKVDKGQVIGYVGNTGLSTACHLHFSAKRDGSSIAPMTYIGWNKEAKKDRG